MDCLKVPLEVNNNNRDFDPTNPVVTVYSPRRKSHIEFQRISLNWELLNAVKENDVSLVKQLLSNNADINATDECGYSALHWAIIYNIPKLVDLFLNQTNCHTNTSNLDKDGYSPLHLAIIFNNKQIVQLLINYGVNLNIHTKGGRNAEDIALANNSWDIVTMLQKARKNQRKKEKDIPKKWCFERLLGAGAYGQVYLGKDSLNGREMAVKKLKTDLTQRTGLVTQQIEELNSRIKMMGNLNHVNVLKYYGLERDHSTVYIFMEYLPGGNMHDLIQCTQGLSEVQIRLYTRQILSGVTYLHTNMVIHRDIKGANILLNAKHNLIKLADFGLALKMERCSISANLRSVIGSPYWMAPEVVKATPTTGNGYGRKADIWSIGCTVYEMYTSNPPLSHLEPMCALYTIGAGRMHPEVPQGVSWHLKDLMEQCFKRDPRSRPSAVALLNHPFLTTHLNDEGKTSAKSTSALKRNQVLRFLASPGVTLAVNLQRTWSRYLSEICDAELFTVNNDSPFL